MARGAQGDAIYGKVSGRIFSIYLKSMPVIPDGDGKTPIFHSELDWGIEIVEGIKEFNSIIVSATP